MSMAEDNSIEDMLRFAAARQLSLSREGLKQTVMALCGDSRPVPRDPAVGPGRKLLDLFLQRYPPLAVRSSRIHEADRVIAAEEDHIRGFDAAWQDYLDKEKPATDDIRNTDVTGASQSVESRPVLCDTVHVSRPRARGCCGVVFVCSEICCV